MGRTAVIFLTLACLAWQSFAAVVAGVAPGGREAIAHAVMHWQEIPHHHGHDHHDGPEAGWDDPHGHDGDEGDAPHEHPAPGDAASGSPAPDGLTVHVDDSTESHGHLAAGQCCPAALLSAILTPPPVPGGITPGLAPALPELPPLADGLFRPPRRLAA